MFIKFICAAIQIWTRILLSQSPSIMQSWEPGPSAAGSPLRLSSGWDVLSLLESQISSSHPNHRAALHLINDLQSRGPRMDPQWSGVPTQICSWSFGNLRRIEWFLFYKDTSVKTVREASGRGGIPQVSPLLERDLQVDWQQLQRELWEGSSRSSQLRKRQAQNSLWRSRTN